MTASILTGACAGACAATGVDDAELADVGDARGPRVVLDQQLNGAGLEREQGALRRIETAAAAVAADLLRRRSPHVLDLMTDEVQQGLIRLAPIRLRRQPEPLLQLRPERHVRAHHAGVGAGHERRVDMRKGDALGRDALGVGRGGHEGQGEQTDPGEHHLHRLSFVCPDSDGLQDEPQRRIT
jgi:hypothetical protein